jgi:type II secretory pathway component PulF
MIRLRLQTTRRDGVELLNRLSQLLTQDVGVIDALRVCASGSEDTTSLATTVLRNVGRGVPFHRVFGALVPGVSPSELAMLAAAERGGTLQDSIVMLSSWMRENSQIRTQAVQALCYPLCLVVASCLSVVFLSISVVPGFAGLYASQGQELPPLTAAVMRFGAWVDVNAPSVLLAIGLSSIVALATAIKSPTFRSVIWRGVDHCPGLGAFVEAATKARASKFASVLLQSGCELEEAIDLAAGASPELFGLRMRRAATALRRGALLSKAWQANGLARGGPDVVLLQLAEATGSYPNALHQIAAAATARADTLFRRSIASFQGFAMILSATLVGIGAAALYEPILGSTSMVSGALL